MTHLKKKKLLVDPPVWKVLNLIHQLLPSINLSSISQKKDNITKFLTLTKSPKAHKKILVEAYYCSSRPIGLNSNHKNLKHPNKFWNSHLSVLNESFTAVFMYIKCNTVRKKNIFCSLTLSFAIHGDLARYSYPKVQIVKLDKISSDTVYREYLCSSTIA